MNTRVNKPPDETGISVPRTRVEPDQFTIPTANSHYSDKYAATLDANAAVTDADSVWESRATANIIDEPEAVTEIDQQSLANLQSELREAGRPDSNSDLPVLGPETFEELSQVQDTSPERVMSPRPSQPASRLVPPPPTTGSGSIARTNTETNSSSKPEQAKPQPKGEKNMEKFLKGVIIVIFLFLALIFITVMGLTLILMPSDQNHVTKIINVPPGMKCEFFNPDTGLSSDKPIAKMYSQKWETWLNVVKCSDEKEYMTHLETLPVSTGFDREILFEIPLE